MGNVGKDAKNDHFKNKYATLEAVLGEVRPPLNANKFLLLQPTTYSQRATPTGDTVTVCETTTFLIHAEGGAESFLSELFVKNNPTPQDQLSASTYNRRYSLMSIFSLAPEDDDGNAASLPKKQAPKVDTEEEKVTKWEGLIRAAKGNPEKLSAAKEKVGNAGFAAKAVERLLKLIEEVSNG